MATPAEHLAEQLGDKAVEVIDGFPSGPEDKAVIAKAVAAILTDYANKVRP